MSVLLSMLDVPHEQKDSGYSLNLKDSDCEAARVRSTEQTLGGIAVRAALTFPVKSKPEDPKRAIGSIGAILAKDSIR